jgi:signal transduction histidine kinase
MINRGLVEAGSDARIVLVGTRSAFCAALADEEVAVVLAREETTGFGAVEACEIARRAKPFVPFICIFETMAGKGGSATLVAADDWVSADSSAELVPALRRALKTAALLAERRRDEWQARASRRLLAVVADLAKTGDIAEIQTLVVRAARDIAGAQGSTFISREGGQYYYAEEDAISPLWKGQRFPLSACAAGWVLSHGEFVAIDDISTDSRIQLEKYRSTFVKSFVLIPLRPALSLGAIGVYWADRHRVSSNEVELLQVLANAAVGALENVRMRCELEQRLERRTRQLEETQREFEAFSFSISHDFRSPITAILGYTDLLREELASDASENVQRACERIIQQSHRMTDLLRDLLRLGQISRFELRPSHINLTQLAEEKLDRLAALAPERMVRWSVAPGLSADGNAGLISNALDHLLSNAWKYTGKTKDALITIGLEENAAEGRRFFVKDNGVGFNSQQRDRLFKPFQRLHGADEFPGAGIGLAIVQRIINRHGGRVWGEGEVNQGAKFSFTLPAARIQENMTEESIGVEVSSGLGHT